MTQTHTQTEPREEGKCTEFCHRNQRRKSGCGPEFCLKNWGHFKSVYREKINSTFPMCQRSSAPTASGSLETKIAIGIITVVTLSVLHSEHAWRLIHWPLLFLLLLLPVLYSVWLVLHRASKRMELPLFSRNRSYQQTCANKPAAFTNICTRHTGPDLIPKMMAGTVCFTLCAL